MHRVATLVLSLLAVSAAVGACGEEARDEVELPPLEPKPSVPGSPIDASLEDAGDAFVPPTPIGLGFDGGAGDAAVSSDASDASAAVVEPCPPVGTTPSTGARYAFAVRAKPPKVLDGDLADWHRCRAILLDSSTAARVKGTTNASAYVYLEWEPDALWIGAEIADPFADGVDPTRPYLNDSLEVYVSGSGVRTGDYGPLDRQIIVDHQGLARQYASAHDVGPFSNAMVAKTPTGYRVEMRIESSAFSTAPLAKGDVKFLDVMLNDGAGQAAFLVWAMQPHDSCACTSCVCNRSPAFDTLLFAPITLK